MTTSPDNDLDLNLHFLPDWAKQSSDVNAYSKYTGSEETTKPRRGGRGPRREGRGPGRGPRREGDMRSGGRGPRAGGGGPRRGGGRKPGGRERTRKPVALPQLKVGFVAAEKGVDSLARQIKVTGRAYPLFEIGRMILEKPERHTVVISVTKGADGKIAQPIFVCALDDTLWLSEDEAVQHVLNRHFDTFYQTEKIPTDPPKGTYTFVAQCGISGRILGPPNHHDYQNKIHALHRERFSRMPFEQYKSRIKIVRDEEVVKQWIEEQSWRTEFICLNLPEAKKLTSREEVEQHFREVHKESIIKSVESQTLPGPEAHRSPCGPIQRLVRSALEEQRRFPLKVVNVLSQQFAARGLQFFKVNKTFTHVSVARPHYLDMENNPVSEGVRRIVEYINANPECNRKQLIEALAPVPLESPSPAPAPTESQTGPETESEAKVESTTEAKPESETEEAAAPAERRAEETSETPTPSAEQQAVITDLHWLIHQGHVIEFANGILETAKKPAPKPPPKPKEPAVSPAPESKQEAAEATLAPAHSGEGPVPPDTESSAPNATTSESAPMTGEGTEDVQAPEEKPSSTNAELPHEPPTLEPTQAPVQTPPAERESASPEKEPETEKPGLERQAEEEAKRPESRDAETRPSDNDLPEKPATSTNEMGSVSPPGGEKEGHTADTSPPSEETELDSPRQHQ